MFTFIYNYIYHIFYAILILLIHLCNLVIEISTTFLARPSKFLLSILDLILTMPALVYNQSSCSVTSLPLVGMHRMWFST